MRLEEEDEEKEEEKEEKKEEKKAVVFSGSRLKRGERKS